MDSLANIITLTMLNIQYTTSVSSQSDETLTLKAPITTAADDKFCDIFPNFQKK